MKTIFEELRKDHDLQRDLLSKMVDTKGNSEQRKDVFTKLKKQLLQHAKYEERALYKPMMNLDNTQGKARHSIAEHKEIEDYIEELNKTELSSPHWISVAKKLDDRVRHHLDEEEQEFFKSAGIAFSDTKKQELAKVYTEGMNR